MRAGLLSDPRVIEEINQKFVSTWIIIDDATKLAEKGDPLAKTLAATWEYPVDFMFLTPEGKVVSKLNSFKDFKDMHRDVAAPPGKDKPPEGAATQSNVDIFLQRAAEFLGGRTVSQR